VKILCPRCEQDHIVGASIRATGTELFICPECDAIWFSIEKIGVGPFMDYGTYMQSMGLSMLWDELDVISEEP
jgi:hypothetical protein